MSMGRKIIGPTRCFVSTNLILRSVMPQEPRSKTDTFSKYALPRSNSRLMSWTLKPYVDFLGDMSDFSGQSQTWNSREKHCASKQSWVRRTFGHPLFRWLSLRDWLRNTHSMIWSNVSTMIKHNWWRYLRVNESYGVTIRLFEKSGSIWHQCNVVSFRKWLTQLLPSKNLTITESVRRVLKREGKQGQ